VAKAIDVLMNEHRLIERALGSLETYAADLRAGAPPSREVVGDYAAFFRGFADRCHHGKEEDILFQRLLERGLPRHAGPLAVMYHEHEVGRASVRELTAIAARPTPAGAADRDEVLACAGAYVPLLREHILKEDHVLYPMALQVLTGPELDAMEAQFAAFETGLRADGSYDALEALAERLVARFAPDPARMAAAAQMSHCGR
jgi:hemerythrin-like domain-containing protein